MIRTSHTCASSTDPSPPRHLTITRVFDDGIELNWIPPREPNGDIRHYIIKYIAQNRQQEINTTNNMNYYNLTGLERGQIYNNITVVAVNSAGGGGESQPITNYAHNSTVKSTSELEDSCEGKRRVGCEGERTGCEGERRTGREGERRAGCEGERRTGCEVLSIGL